MAEDANSVTVVHPAADTEDIGGQEAGVTDGLDVGEGGG